MVIQIEESDMDKQREMFEAWYSKHCEPGVGPWFVRDKDNSDEYHMSHTQTAWDAWQAALAAQPAPRCACGDSFTSDAVCANCLAAEWEPIK